MSRYKKPVLNLVADDVWAAACAAQRINGRYIKNLIDIAEGQDAAPNRILIDQHLANPSFITEVDRKQGELVRNYYKGLTFKILQGKKLNEFDNNAMVIANRDIINETYDLAVIASLPSCYDRAFKRDSMNRKLESATGGFIGQIGDKVQVSLEVVRTVFSQQWNVFFVSGITSEDQAVFFSNKESFDSGTYLTIKGTVKAHRENSTQLNRVKVL